MAHAVPSQEIIKKAFDAFDLDKSGAISLAELYNVLHHAGVKVTQAQCQQLISKYDSNHDGSLEIEEFTELVNHASKLLKSQQ